MSTDRASSAVAGAGDPVAPIPLRDFARWLWLAGALLLIVYLVSMDQGAVSRLGSLLHEAMHDGRHLLGVPCH
jgi:hypothetical protein